MNWQPIETAPQDGTVILTDEGSARYGGFWGCPAGWYLCDTGGDIPSCADEGYRVSIVGPKVWVPFPSVGDES